MCISCPYFVFVDIIIISNYYFSAILMHIYEKLNTEDTNSRSFRITIGFSQVVKKVCTILLH